MINGPVDSVRPDAPRWRVHIEVQGQGPDMLLFRASLDDRLMSLSPERGAVVTADLSGVALTFSVFGQDAEEAILDAKCVIVQFGIPSEGMTIEMLSPEQIERRRRAPMPLLMGVKEVAEHLGYSRQRISQLAREEGEFPPPITSVGATPIWVADEIVEWRDKHRRSSALKRPRKSGVSE